MAFEVRSVYLFEPVLVLRQLCFENCTSATEKHIHAQLCGAGLVDDKFGHQFVLHPGKDSEEDSPCFA